MVRAKRKIGDALNWRGDVNVSLGDETVTFEHRLLQEEELYDVKDALNLDELQSKTDENLGQTEAQERLLELQQKNELTDEEEEELQQLTEAVMDQTEKIERALGDDAYDKLMEAGKRCIEPTDEDVEFVYNASPGDMKEYMGVEKLPNPLTKDVIREHLREELREMVSNQPYPIKLNVGLQAFSETLSVLGNGLQK